MKIPFIFILVFLTTISCNRDCHKNNSCEPVFYEFNLDSVAEYLFAKKGSYWIYKDTKTGEIDTQTCVGFRIDTIVDKGDYEYSNNITIKYQRLYSLLWCTRKQWYVSNSTNVIYADSYSDIRNFDLTIIRYTRQTPYASADCFFHPFDSNRLAGTGGYLCKLIGFEPNLTIQGKLYQNIVKFRIDTFDPTWTNEFDEKFRRVTYYWAKNVGMIKREPEGYGGSIELIDYEIIK